MSRQWKPNFNFFKYQWWFLSASCLVILGTFILLFTRGLNFGVDFRGGLTLIYTFQQETNEADITQALAQAGVQSFVVQRYGTTKEKSFLIKSDFPKTTDEQFSAPISNALAQAYGPDSFTMIKEEFVGPKVGKELRTKGIYAIICSWIVMLIYIGFRFDFYFAPGAIVALIHDVLVTVGAFALTGREVNLTVLAALLTIVGFSVNDTIVIFDRVRENTQKHKTMTLVKLVNLSLNETLSRTIITSLTVFFVVVVLFVFTQGDIKNFAFAMIVGVIAGSYSTIFIASPVFLFLKKYGHYFGMKDKKKS